MKINRIRVNRFDVAGVVRAINEATEGRNVESVFYEQDGLFTGEVVIKTKDEEVIVIEIPKKYDKVSEKYKSHEYKKSKYRGVQWDKLTAKWRARIQVNGKRISLGVYDTEYEAAMMYDRQALKTHGSKAKLNFDIKDHIAFILEGMGNK